MTIELDFLVIGHLTVDIEGTERIPGGPAYYSALTAARLGKTVSLLTSGASSTAKNDLDTKLNLINIPAPITTTFENIYVGELRKQIIHSSATPLEIRHLSAEWYNHQFVLLTPVFNEVDPAFASSFPNAVLGVLGQGWMRKSDDLGNIKQVVWNNPEIYSQIQVLIISENDIRNNMINREWIEEIETFILTLGSRGAIMHHNNQWFRIPPYPAHAEHPTGAGDVFGAAYLVRYSETYDPFASSLFASCAASLKVENRGFTGVPTREKIVRRMNRFQDLEITHHINTLPSDLNIINGS